MAGYLDSNGNITDVELPPGCLIDEQHIAGDPSVLIRRTIVGADVEVLDEWRHDRADELLAALVVTPEVFEEQ